MPFTVTPEGTVIPDPDAGYPQKESLAEELARERLEWAEKIEQREREELEALGEETGKRFREGRRKRNRMGKLSVRLRAARIKGGRTSQVLELASALGGRAVLGRGAGMLRGLGGLSALAALGYFGGKTAYDIVQGETNLLGVSARDQALANMAGQRSAQQYEEAARARRMASAMENQRMQRSIMENLQQVAQNNPALYNQVSAGRRLPRGAVVLGGQQRQDLLTELARAMDSGSFRQQDPLSDLIG